MKRSEYKAARERTFRALGYGEPLRGKYAEGDTSAQESLPDFPGWDPEEPEPCDETAAPQQTEAEKAEEPEWFKWDDPNGRSRVSLSGTPRLECWSSRHREYRHAPNASVATGWKDAIVAGIRLLAEERRLALGQVASLRARDITQQEEIRRLGAEFTRISDLYSTEVSRLQGRINRLELEAAQDTDTAEAEVSRLQGEVQMAEAKAKEALGEIAHWKARALLATGKRTEAEALYRESQNARVQLAGEVEDLREELRGGEFLPPSPGQTIAYLESEVVRLRAELRAARARAADTSIGESLRQEHGPAPFSRDEWRYDFAGRYMAALSRIGDGPREDAGKAVEAADALLEALEALGKGEAGAEAEKAAEDPPRVAGEAVLALTADEAGALRAVTATISGDRSSSRRRYIDSIARKLWELGFDDYDARDLRGKLRFNAKPQEG